MGPVLADTGAEKWIFQLNAALSLLTTPACSSAARCLHLPQPRSGRDFGEVGGGSRDPFRKCIILANLTEENTSIRRACSVSHIKNYIWQLPWILLCKPAEEMMQRRVKTPASMGGQTTKNTHQLGVWETPNRSKDCNTKYSFECFIQDLYLISHLRFYYKNLGHPILAYDN